MLSERSATYLFIAFMSGIGFWLGAETLGVCEFKPVDVEALKIGPGACLEFWLNRYQGLMGGLCTLAAAIIAGVLVLRQIREASRQTSIMMGDLPPDFVLRQDPRFHAGEDFYLSVVNHNRHSIEVQYLRIVSPRNIEVTVNTDEGIQQLGKNNAGGTDIRAIIAGAANAGPFNQKYFYGAFFLILSDKKDYRPTIENLIMEIGFEVLDGTGNQQSVRRTLNHARMSGFVVVGDGSLQASVNILPH